MKFYNVEREYLDSLRTIEPKILEIYGNERPYIGILMTINNKDYYAPLSSYKENMEKLKLGLYLKLPIRIILLFF